jgi:hypothetical protein
MRFDKGNPDENFDIVIAYDVLNSDPETQESKLNQLVSLMQLDRNGRINPDALLEMSANAIDPIAADSILQPAESGQQQVVKGVTDDLTKIFAGIEMPARPNGAQIALQILQQYAQQPDVAQRLQQDESFRGRIEKYAAQYTFPDAAVPERPDWSHWNPASGYGQCEHSGNASVVNYVTRKIVGSPVSRFAVCGLLAIN